MKSFLPILFAASVSARGIMSCNRGAQGNGGCEANGKNVYTVCCIYDIDTTENFPQRIWTSVTTRDKEGGEECFSGGDKGWLFCADPDNNGQ
ncbi:hypothetical protein CLAFUW4_01678 [Fulvia fulva]|uniref:Extracellular protein 9-5 n=1 Tax=Passalora fulva TaxID=5499 RepID=A0A1P8YXQ6_PASFU|nr:uncharacterized protein CLAFUR5_20130 [Fulvia fulva]AQA29288.1 extracellular protein 9-5 [Fulvia fulva]KAK4634403.1 hypothetical protein CLAFUR4_01676 [Fulvia fulva]KAK4638550.1 hypothetical protein CLAFUR0_01677 [Fulvia fulva]WMI38762.1 hypothetical protein CLAFUR5_20130 [Fulvia fulva]WPV09291.1 hypothetical protein CLAFUW4_01678 [Fulvia fulva]